MPKKKGLMEIVRQVMRSSGSGRFVKKKYAKKNPKTTEKQLVWVTVKRAKKKKRA